MHGQTYVGERVFYLRAVVEAEPAHQLVAESSAAEHFFKCARLKIGAVLHGASLRGIIVQDALEFSRDKFGLGVRVAPLEVFQVGATAVLRAEGLAQALRVVGDYRASGVQDLLRGA